MRLGRAITIGMYLTQTQFDILRSWAQQTRQIRKADLFGSHAKGEADSDSDIDVAIRASAVDWTFRTAQWEQYLTKAIGIQVRIRTLALPNVRRYCQEKAAAIESVRTQMSLVRGYCDQHPLGDYVDAVGSLYGSPSA